MLSYLFAKLSLAVALLWNILTRPWPRKTARAWQKAIAAEGFYPVSRSSREIVTGGCIGCGLCQSLLGPKAQHLSMEIQGTLRHPTQTGLYHHRAFCTLESRAAALRALCPMGVDGDHILALCQEQLGKGPKASHA